METAAHQIAAAAVPPAVGGERNRREAAKRWEQVLEEGLQRTGRLFGLPTRQELNKLWQRIEKLEARIEALREIMEKE